MTRHLASRVSLVSHNEARRVKPPMAGTEPRPLQASSSKLGSSHRRVASRATATPIRSRPARELVSRLTQTVSIVALGMLKSRPRGAPPSGRNVFQGFLLHTSDQSGAPAWQCQPQQEVGFVPVNGQARRDAARRPGSPCLEMSSRGTGAPTNSKRRRGLDPESPGSFSVTVNVTRI